MAEQDREAEMSSLLENYASMAAWVDSWVPDDNRRVEQIAGHLVDLGATDQEITSGLQAHEVDPLMIDRLQEDIVKLREPEGEAFTM